MRKFLKYFLLTTFLLVVVIFIASIILLKPDFPSEEVIEKYKTPTSHFIEMDGMKVHYILEGSGEQAVVLIHGTGSCFKTWDAWKDSLKNDYTVLIPDMPGFGLTGPQPEGNYSINYFTSFIKRLTDTLGIDSIYLAGNSLGGEIAWRFAERYPMSVSKLLLADPAGAVIDRKKGNEALVFKIAANPFLARNMQKFDSKMMVKRTLKDVYGDDAKVTPQQLSMYYDMSMRAGNRKAFVDRMQMKGQEKGDATKVKATTLILWGDKDILIPIEEMEYFKKIPNAKTKVYIGVGHSPQEEIPAESAHDALQFFKN
ncbi:MAG: alpha/beta hydrolase [Chitinophagales bacterium]|nr:alpha/beta hydrolase [Chitinophagales bacterium]